MKSLLGVLLCFLFCYFKYFFMLSSKKSTKYISIKYFPITILFKTSLMKIVHDEKNTDSFYILAYLAIRKSGV